MLNRGLFLFLFFWGSFNVLCAMEQSSLLKGILKKTEAGSKKKGTKRVKFKHPLETRSGEGWSQEVLLKLYNGSSTEELKNKGFEVYIINKASEHVVEVDAIFKTLLDFPVASISELEKLGFSKLSLCVAKTVFGKVCDLAKHCLIAPQNPNELEGVSEKIVKLVSDLVGHVKEIRETSQKVGHSQAAIKIAKRLGYLKKKRTHLYCVESPIVPDNFNQKEKLLKPKPPTKQHKCGSAYCFFGPFC